uniref:CRIB domain-containing protein n=1 Tax=Electrophorus electricus TaxID=8005 RepID=A0A4W4ECR8_ELEEL
MPAKTPIYLKSNNHKKGKKCRLRDILSPDMISPPLGDFRHTIHIGKGGECDTFGDMSFLQGKFELLPGKGGMIRPQYGTHGEFTRANSASDASFIETPSPILKNAISLPTIGGSQAITLPLISTTIFPMTQDPLDGLAGLPTPVPEEVVEKPTFTINLTEKPSAKKTTCHNNKHNTENKKPEKLLKSASQESVSQVNGSLLSLELDLGPSILDDVLNIMRTCPTNHRTRPGIWMS